MAADLIAILKSVAGISEAIKSGKELIDRIVGKEDKDKKLIDQTRTKIEEMTTRLENISKSGHSLNAYRDLYEVSLGLRMRGNTIYSDLGNILAQPFQEEPRYIKDSIERAYNDLKLDYKRRLKDFLIIDEYREYVDKLDVGYIELSIQKMNDSFSKSDGLIEQPKLNYTILRTYIRNIADASDDLEIRANTKIRTIADTLVGLKI